MPQPYTGLTLAFLTFVLSMANVMEVLDLTIANVAIPTITGDLAVAPSQGAWVITSYAVANAITVPLAGWFAGRFGQVRIYATMIACFTGASLLCALAGSLEMLVAFRVLQGAAAGFMVPLSQALLLSNFPPQKRGMALAIWVMTITVAPIIGPLLGGWITDNYHWSWIFLINLPFGVFASITTWLMLRDRDTPIRKLPVDWTGIALIVLWVGCLQILLDKGNELDWFHSGFIVALGVVAAFGFALFLAWELTETHPVVDLDLFRFRNFRSGVVTVSLGYALFFAGVILLPLWLQTQLGYTSQWAGYALAPGGVFAMLFAPVVGRAHRQGRRPEAARHGRLPHLRRHRVLALDLHYRDRLRHRLAAAMAAGRRRRLLLRAAVFHQPERHSARAHRQRHGAAEFPAHDARQLRRLDHHRGLGPPPVDPPHPADRARQCLRYAGPRHDRPADGDGHEHGQRLRADQPHGRQPGLHAGDQRRVLGDHHPVRPADRAAVDHQAAVRGVPRGALR